MYAIVDIETTGSYAAGNGITEIAICLFDGKDITHFYQSLINPRQSIPRYITALTGITDEMTGQAPSFEQVAEEIYTLLNGKVFIAHNVNFDYSFVKAQLAACGYELQAKKLCTVRLSRKLLPGLPSYSLGNLCRSLDIPINNRHRAGGDAQATVKVFERLLQQDSNGFISQSLSRSSKEQVLPPNVPREQFERLPYTPGVYYFHNEKGKIIYVGKARNIRYRVNSHFSNNSQTRQKQNFLRHTHSISFQPCATELMAHILESAEIKKWWPAFNHSQKNAESVYGIFLYEDQRGYYRLAIEKNKKQLQPVHSFHYLTEGHIVLRRLIREYQLCPCLCFMQTGPDKCEGTKDGSCLGACEGKEPAQQYNARLQQAISSLDAQPTFAILENGLGSDDRSCVLVWKGKFYGMGYIPADVTIMQPEDIKDHLTPYRENLFIRNLVHSYATRHPAKVTWFSGTPTEATESLWSAASGKILR